MSEAAGSPYAAPRPAAEAIDDPGYSPAVSMRYMEAIRFPFAGPHAWTNILMVSIGNLVPVVGPIVVSGFLYDTLEALFRQKRSYAPPFDFDRLSEYLLRGVWLFLVQLVVTMIFVLPSMFVLMFGQIGGMILLEEGGDAAPLGIVVIGGSHLVHFGLMALMGLLMMPLSIRVGLLQDFAKAFDFAWYRSFFGKMWIEMLVVSLLAMFLGTVYMFLGLLAFCIGIYVALAVLLVTSMHLQFQLYLLYLARGGKAVELKEPSPKAIAAWSK